jgi:hypothetical protein
MLPYRGCVYKFITHHNFPQILERGFYHRYYTIAIQNNVKQNASMKVKRLYHDRFLSSYIYIKKKKLFSLSTLLYPYNRFVLQYMCLLDIRNLEKKHM